MQNLPTTVPKILPVQSDMDLDASSVSFSGGDVVDTTLPGSVEVHGLDRAASLETVARTVTAVDQVEAASGESIVNPAPVLTLELDGEKTWHFRLLQNGMSCCLLTRAQGSSMGTSGHHLSTFSPPHLHNLPALKWKCWGQCRSSSGQSH